MSNWHDLLRGKGGESMLYEGVISQNASNVLDQLLVTVLAFDKELTWGPMPWMPRVDDTGTVVLPQEGDRCLVGLAATDDPGTPEPWIAAWWPE